jgi:hypothetical protein
MPFNIDRRPARRSSLGRSPLNVLQKTSILRRKVASRLGRSAGWNFTTFYCRADSYGSAHFERVAALEHGRLRANEFIRRAGNVRCYGARAADS